MEVMVAKKVKRTMQKENSILIRKKKNRMFKMRMLNKEKKVMEMVMTTWRMNQRVKSSNLKRTMVMIRRMIINRREKLRLKIIKSTIMVINMNITMQ